MFGKRMTVDEVLDEVEKDTSIYRSTGADDPERRRVPAAAGLASALLKGAHDRGSTRLSRRRANVPWRFVEQVLPHVDTCLHDHKLTIPERHKKWTGVSNERILSNFKKAYETFSPTSTSSSRTPLIPGINADEEHIRAVLGVHPPAQET